MITAMAGRWEAVYTQDQRDAMAYAYEDRRVRPARRVVELAAAGELTHNGVKLKPFKTNDDTIRHEARKLRNARGGEITSQLGQAPHRDAIEKLRVRLINAADALLIAYERGLTRDPDHAEPEKLRQIVRVVREAAALPGPTDPRPAAPGQRVNGHKDGAETTGGPGGALMQDHRRTAGAGKAEQTEPEPSPSILPNAQRTPETPEPSTTAPARSAQGQTEQHDDGTPGALVRELVERVTGGVEEAPRMPLRAGSDG